MGLTSSSSEAKCTRPSRIAYKESINDLVILAINAGASRFCFTERVDEDELRSIPPAILNAAVVSCF